MIWLFIIGGLFILAGFYGITDSIMVSLICWLIGGLLIFLGVRKLRKKKTAAAPKERTLTTEDFHAAGISYYESNIRKLATANPDWKLTTAQILKAGKSEKRIFQHNYVNKPVKLIPEPKNPHDKNAVAIHIAGELVGYISRADNLHVLDILQHREVISISGFIGGGKFKVVSDDGEIVKDELDHSVNIRIKYI